MSNKHRDKPLILIGVPGWAGIQPEVQQAFMRMIFRCGRDMPGYEFAVEIIVKREQFRSRNQLVDAAIGAGAEWLLMLDDDMSVPPDLVSRLIEHDKDVIGALYWQRGGAYHPVVMRKIDMPTGEFQCQFLAAHDPIIQKPGLHEVDIIGGGCMLFRVDVFRKITPPTFWWEGTLGTDVAICTRLKEAGVKIWIDTSIELGHLSNEKPIITGQQIPLGTQALGVEQELLWEDMTSYLGIPPSELESRMVQASRKEQRQAMWHDQPRETWEQIRNYYTEGGDWHLLNLLFFAMQKRDAITQWVLTQAETRLKPQSRIVDLGPGLGLISVALARKGHAVHAVELANTPTLEFLRWRRAHRNVSTLILEPFRESVPEYGDDIHRADCVIMSSMLDHCYDPYGTLAWSILQLKPGGLLLCDYQSQARETEPQHLVRYDPMTLPQWLHERGMDQAPDYPWMFTKRG